MRGSATTAPIPTAAYPTSSFFGAVGLSPQIQRGMASDTQAVKPQSKLHILLIVAAFVIGGYALFHFNEM